MVAKVRERLAVSKQSAQNLDIFFIAEEDDGRGDTGSENTIRIDIETLLEIFF